MQKLVSTERTEGISNWTCGEWGNMKTELATVKNTSTSSFERKLGQMSSKCSSMRMLLYSLSKWDVMI